jgi:hypothetical protein
MSIDRPGAKDFDFLFGRWRVEHQRLRTRLAHCTDWQAFEGHSETRPLLGGLGNVEDNLIELPGASYRASALRSFDATTGRWAIWWIDGRQPHHLDPPVVGEFDQGAGSFYADDQLDGRAIRVRFLWLDTRTAQPRWEQAFSEDGGKHWEVNWRMRFNRLF